MGLSQRERAALLALARAAIKRHLGGEPPPRPGELTDRLELDCGAFVTLHENGNLRGCIGTFTSDEPLYRTVAEMALAAATKDPRFAPVTPEELDEINLEISVLSPLREVSDPEEIEVGRHGIYIVRGDRAGVLLPQVATEWGFDRTGFLDATCNKAGLPAGCWKEAGTRVLVFEAEVFGEEAPAED